MALPLSVFEAVKQIPSVEVALRYLPGLELRQRGNRYIGRCPFHQDRMPSFVIFPDGGWRCFGCQAGGDQVELVARALNLRPLEAARTIAQDFGLQVDNQPLTPEARKRAKDVQFLREQERVLRKQADTTYFLLAHCFQIISQRLSEDYLNYKDLETTAMVIEQVLDELQSDDTERQKAALKYFAEWCQHE